MAKYNIGGYVLTTCMDHCMVVGSDKHEWLLKGAEALEELSGPEVSKWSVLLLVVADLLSARTTRMDHCIDCPFGQARLAI